MWYCDEVNIGTLIVAMTNMIHQIPCSYETWRTTAVRIVVTGEDWSMWDWLLECSIESERKDICSLHWVHQKNTRFKADLKLKFGKLNKVISEEWRKENPPMGMSISLYTICRSFTNHSSCSKVSSESYFKILQSFNTTVTITTMPYHQTSQLFLNMTQYTISICLQPHISFKSSKIIVPG
jgi:hypothetical protein